MMQMYWMDLRHPRMSWPRALAIVFGIVVVVMLLIVIAGMVSNAYAGYLAYGAVLVLAMMVLNRFVIEYRYRLDEEGVFCIERLAGERTRPLMRAAIVDVVYYGEEQASPASVKNHKFTLSEYAGRTRVLIVKKDEELTSVYIQPDEKMDALLREAIGKKEQA